MGVQPHGRKRRSQSVKDGIQRHQGQHRRKHLHQHQRRQKLPLPGELQTGQGVSSGGGQQQGHHARGQRHLNRIPQPPQHGQVGLDHLPIGAGIRQAQHVAPMLQADAVRHERAAGEIAGPQRHRQHHKKRKQHGRTQAKQKSVSQQHTPALGFGLNEGHGSVPGLLQGHPGETHLHQGDGRHDQKDHG